jgi:hypothetical protein
MCDPKPCDACSAPAPSSPTPLDQMRFDYAWKWFDFHAEQRTKMFNYMLIGMGIFATAFVTAVDKKLELEAALLSSVAVIVALVFCFIDHRNRQLYLVAMDVLIDIERNLAFTGRERNTFLDHGNRPKRYGISSRVAWEDMSAPEQGRLDKGEPIIDASSSYLGSVWRHVQGMRRGQHRYWMPFVALSFAALFLGAATRAWLVYSGAVPRVPVAIEGGALLLLGGSFAAWQWFSSEPKKSSVWPIASMLVGSCLLAAAACWSLLREPLTPSARFEVAVGADLTDVLDLRLRQPLDNAHDGQLGAIVSTQFGPFESGAATLDCGSAAQSNAISDIRNALKAAQGGKQRVAVVLVGSTDRTPLLPALRRQYGSDAGLARARIAAVERCLWPGAAAAPSDVLRVVTGPAYTPSAAQPASTAHLSMEGDRYVRAMLVGLQASR